MEFFLIAFAHFFALLSPGPDFFLIIQTAVRMPKRCIVSISAGISLANACYIIAAITSLEVLRNAPMIFAYLQ